MFYRDITESWNCQCCDFSARLCLKHRYSCKLERFSLIYFFYKIKCKKDNCHCRFQTIGVFFIFCWPVPPSHTWFLPVYRVLKALIVCSCFFFTPFHLKSFFSAVLPLYAHVTPRENVSIKMCCITCLSAAAFFALHAWKSFHLSCDPLSTKVLKVDFVSCSLKGRQVIGPLIGPFFFFATAVCYSASCVMSYILLSSKIQRFF